MQVDTQRFLRLAEQAGTLVFVDLESTGFKGDYNSVLCGSILPYQRKVHTSTIKQVGNDQKVVREIKELLEAADIWVTFYGRGFDLKMLNTRLLRWGHPPIQKRPHCDLYFQLKSKLLTSRKSQGHLLSWLGTPEQKMGVSAKVWSEAALDPKNLKILKDRCESDVVGLQDLYERTKHLITDVTT